MVSEEFQTNSLLRIIVIGRNVSINGYKSNLADVKCGVPQGSILEPLLLLI